MRVAFDLARPQAGGGDVARRAGPAWCWPQPGALRPGWARRRGPGHGPAAGRRLYTAHLTLGAEGRTEVLKVLKAFNQPPLRAPNARRQPARAAILPARRRRGLPLPARGLAP
ncbi:MAG: hypothetical protein WKG07_30635 [Hymenobacter sp.]